MTLATKLVRDINNHNPHTEFWLPTSTVQPLERSLTDRHTERTNFIPSTADMGGNDDIDPTSEHAKTCGHCGKPGTFSQPLKPVLKQ